MSSIILDVFDVIGQTLDVGHDNLKYLFGDQLNDRWVYFQGRTSGGGGAEYFLRFDQDRPYQYCLVMKTVFETPSLREEDPDIFGYHGTIHLFQLYYRSKTDNVKTSEADYEINRFRGGNRMEGDGH